MCHVKLCCAGEEDVFEAVGEVLGELDPVLDVSILHCVLYHTPHLVWC